LSASAYVTQVVLRGGGEAQRCVARECSVRMRPARVLRKSMARRFAYVACGAQKMRVVGLGSGARA